MLVAFLIILGLIFIYLLFQIIVKPYLLVRFYAKQGVSEPYFFPMSGRRRINHRNTIIHGDFYYFHKQLIKRNPNVKAITTNQGLRAAVILIDSQLKKEFLYKQQHYLKDELVVAPLKILMGNGLVTSAGDDWKRHRALLSKAFDYNFLRESVKQIDNIAKKSLSEFPTLKGVEMIREFEKITGEVVGVLFFGECLNKTEFYFEGKQLSLALADLLPELIQAIRNGLVLIFGLKIVKWRIVPSQRRILRKIDRFKYLCSKIIEERKKKYKKEKVSSNKTSPVDKDLLDILFEFQENTPEALSDQEILDEFITFFLAGMDTTGHLIAMVAYNLTQYPDYLEMIRNEVALHYKNGSNITIDDLNKMEFLGNFIKETLRMTPPVPALVTRVAIEDHMIGEFKIKKGTLVNINLMCTNFSPKYYDKPEEFNPMRWNNKESINDPFGFIPFSAGARNCIGQHLSLLEAKIVISNFVSMYNFKPIEGYTHKMGLKFMYRPINPLKFDLIKL